MLEQAHKLFNKKKTCLMCVPNLTKVAHEDGPSTSERSYGCSPEGDQGKGEEARGAGNLYIQSLVRPCDGVTLQTSRLTEKAKTIENSGRQGEP